MKSVIVLLLASVAMPAAAQLAMLRNPGVMRIMCNSYADTAEHAAMARDQGAQYAIIKSINDRAVRQGMASSQTLTQEEKAFEFQYLSGAVDYAYLTAPGTSPQRIHDDALAQCMGQFGL